MSTKTGKDVLDLIAKEGARFVDFRFTDTRGKEQHVTVPSHTVDDKLFEDGDRKSTRLNSSHH